MSHYASIKKTACESNAGGKRTPQTAGNNSETIIPPPAGKSKCGKKNKGWHARTEEQVVKLHGEGKTDGEIAAATGASKPTVQRMRRDNGLLPNANANREYKPKKTDKAAYLQFKCRHTDCKYVCEDGSANRCDYIGITNHSRIMWHRKRGLSEEIEDCQLYEKGKRRQQVQGINLEEHEPKKANTTGRLKYPRKAKAKEPKITTVLIRKKEAEAARDALRLELYDKGMTDAEIAKEAGVSAQAIAKWRTGLCLPTQGERKRKRDEAAFLRLYGAGCSLAECEEITGRSRATLAAWRDAAGLAPQGREKMTDERRERREQARSELEAAGLIAAKKE